MNIQYNAGQLAAIEMFHKNRASILTGGPGTGKTTVIKEILSQLSRGAVTLAAPTGKAAKRMSEVTGCEASTIHRTLLASMNEKGQFAFERGEGNPLTCQTLIVDELSMVTNDLMADLLRAVDERRTKVLLVGDAGQLPSVGPGAVLRDMLDSGCVPHTRLTEVMRNTGDVVAACHKIANGEIYKPSDTLDPGNGLNLRHIEAANSLKIQEIIRSLVVERMPQRGYNPMWDVQVISPTNAKGQLSCAAINKILQGALNPAPGQDAAAEDNEAPEKAVIRKGDKVINTKNKPIGSGRRGSSQTYIVNGDMGTVTDEVDQKRWMVEFSDPTREVILPKKNNDLLLAYCITCHRAQGSEMPVVIIPVHLSFKFFLARPWLYTAISRAKEICITVGQFDAIAQSIRHAESAARKTFLREKLQQNIINDADV